MYKESHISRRAKGPEVWFGGRQEAALLVDKLPERTRMLCELGSPQLTYLQGDGRRIWQQDVNGQIDISKAFGWNRLGAIGELFCSGQECIHVPRCREMQNTDLGTDSVCFISVFPQSLGVCGEKGPTTSGRRNDQHVKCWSCLLVTTIILQACRNWIQWSQCIQYSTCIEHCYTRL